MVQLFYVSPMGANIIRFLPCDNAVVLDAVVRLFRRRVCVVIKRDGIVIGGVEPIYGKWSYWFETL